MALHEAVCAEHVTVLHLVYRPDLGGGSIGAESNDHQFARAALHVDVGRWVFPRGPIDPDHESVLADDDGHFTIT